MATLAQLEKALVNADKAGDMDAARKLAAVIKTERARLGDAINIPGYGDIGDVPGTVPDKPGESIGKKIAGVGEAVLSTVTGAVAMPVAAAAGIAGEALSGGKKDGEQIANKVADAMIYQPRTETGGKILETVGKVVEPLVALGPMAAELGAVGEAAAATRPVVRAAAAEAASPIKQAATALAEQVKQKIAPGAERAPTPGTGTSGGAAAVDIADVRRANAEELGFTGDKALTEGQATRAFEQQRFERETAKQGDIGEPIRQRMQNQNLHLQQKMDEFIDSTGSELTEPRGVGEIVDKALRQRAARDKTKIRALYKEAEKAGEMEARVPMDSVVQLLKDSSSAEALAPVIGATERELQRLGVLNYFGRGEGINLKLGDVENLRKFVTKVAGSDRTNIKYASEIKAAIDAATEGKGGDLYKQARAAYAQSMADYENFGLARQLLKSKRGSTDRTVALEDVLRKSVISPSASTDSVTKLKQLLQTEGETGQQAWKELQGGLLRHLKDEATKNVARDSAGNPIVSAAGLDKAVTALDKTGKLDLVLGKRQADKVRLINDVAKDVFTSPPGAVNTSNTATVLAGLMDIAISGTTGVPAPVATVFNHVTSRIKDAKLKARVKQSLGE
ncbi:MAG: hypothetical protein RLZZ200_1118 [Pseudomonadota bacterium]|jgi:hypothetical protein